ncbi:MAG: hypothetical protein CMJ18_07655 [Phycisphaeraceae bacterium]|nr:hypothetical protein [Phycisphaeraceae bacterium]
MSELLRDFNNALDCCGTCAGGVLNRHVTDRLAAVTARAEAAEAKVARIEALVSDYAGAIAVPEWATEYTRGVVDAAQLAHDDLRAALADEGDTDE